MFISTSALTTVELTTAIIREPLVVSPDTTVRDAIALMSGVRSLCHTNKTADEQLEQLNLEVRSSCVLVAEAGQLIGILTERDIVRLSAKRQPLDRLLVQQVMAHPIVTLRESDFTDLFSAINLLQQHHIRHLPIVDDTIHLVGIVTHESLRQIFRPIDLLRLRLAAEVMTREVICATADRPILEIVQLMAQNQVSSVIVVEPRDQPEPLPIPVGIITERDIVQFQALGLNLESCQAEAVMSTPIFTIKPEDSLGHVQELMNQRLIGRLVVTGKQGELLGIVTQTSLLQALNPLELYKLAETLEAKVVKLEADQVALLENRNIELEKQVESRTTALKAKAQQQKLIADIATQIRSSLSLQTILDTTVEQIRQVLDCDRVNIWQLEPDWQTIAVAESTASDSSLSLLGERISDTYFQQDHAPIYCQGYVHIVSDIYALEMSDCHRDLLLGLQIRAQILLPILCGDDLWGLLNVSESQHPRDWQPEEVELLQVLSVQLGIAIQQATTHQQLEHELAIRRRIEATLQESEQRYAALAAAAPVGIFCTDALGNCTYINDRYCQITGLTPKSARSQGWQQGLHPGDRDWVLSQWDNFVGNQHPFEIEYRFQRPDGTITWVYGQSVAERDGNGELVGYVGTITDISDRKRTEAALQQSEERYVTLVEAAPVGIFRTDALGNCVYVNDRWCLMSGLTPKEALGLGWRDGLHPADRESIAIEWYQSAAENRPFQLEYRFQRPDGTVTWVYGQSVSELNAEGQVVGYVGTVTDISDRQRSEAELAKSAAHQQALISAIPDLMMRINRAGIYLEFIATSYQLSVMGNASKMIGSHVYESLPAELAQKRMEFINLALDQNSIQVYEQVFDVDGRRQVEEVRVVPYSQDEVLVLVRDISDRKQAEMMLQEVNQKLETKVKERTQELSQVNSLQRAILDGADYSIISCDLTGIIQTFNAAAERILGYQAAEIIGKVTPAILHDPKEVIERAAILSAELGQEVPPGFDVFVVKARQGIITETEWTYIRKNGSSLTVSLSISPLKDAHQQIIGFLGIAQDITERKMLAAKLVYSENKLRSIFESITDIILIINLEEPDYASIELPPVSNLVNLRHAEVSNKTVDDFLLDSSTNGWLQKVQEALAAGSPIQFDYSLNVGEEVLWFSAVISPINANTVTWVARDITERKQAEIERQQLIQELSAFKLALDQSAIVAITDARGVITYVNERFCEISGYSRDELIGETHRLVHSGYHPREFFQDLWRTIARGEIWRGEICNRTKNGNIYWVESTIVPFLDAQGRPFQHLGIRFDITDRKLAEAAIQQENSFRRQIVENMTEGLCVCHAVEEFPFVYFTVWNQQMQGITGYSLKDINQLGWYQSLYPDLEVRTRAIERMGRMRKGENMSAEEWEIQRQDGERRIISISTSVLSINDERIYILALIQDITARKQTELENLLLKERLEFLLSSSPAMIYSCKPFGEYAATFMSKNIEAILGYKPEQFLSESGFWAKHIHPDDAPRIFAELYHLFEHDFHLHEYRFLHHDGYYVWIRDELRLLRDEQGNPAEIVGYFADISDIKQSEQIIKKQAERETLLREITQRIRQSLDLQTIFETATQEIRRFLEMDRVAIFKFDPESGFDDGEFVAESVTPGFMSVLKVKVHDRCFGEHFAQLYQQGKIQVGTQQCYVPTIENADLLDCHQVILSQFQVRGNLILPLLNGEVLWGLLCIHQCSNPREWQDAEINFVQEISNQLAIAIQQANLYEQVQSELVIRKQAEKSISLQLQRQRTLGEIAQQIRESLDINQILATVTQQVKEILLGDRVIVFRLFDDGTSQIVEEAVSSQFTTLKDRHLRDEVWDQEILNYYWQGKPRIVPDVMNDIWTACMVEYSIEGQIQSKIVAPILQEVRTKENHRWVAQNQSNKLWGILVIHSCAANRVWQESEAQLLQQIANNLGIAIQQAHLFEQLQQELQERQQAQQELTERNQQLGISNEELARATRLKDEFLANMSHELRTPLNAILGMTEGLQDAVFGNVNEAQIKALQTIEKSGSHLLSLINDILDLAKIESGKIELERTPVSINYLCQSSLAFIKQQALQKHIHLEIKQSLNLPDLLIDERRIRQVLINLLNNAVKFTPEGGNITLEVSHKMGNVDHNLGEQISPISPPDLLSQNYLEIAVIDTGIGISPADIKKLFQPFMQIDSALNRQYQGTGLGLALVKRIVELHGGQINLTSEVGQGSCFTIKLPCTTAVSAATELTESSSPIMEPNQSNQTNSPLILLAEDNEANVITVSSYLGAKGYRIINAKNGQEAIDFAKLHQPNLILMDIQMPGMDGLEAMREIRRDPELVNLPIIALTALAMSGDRERCLAAGANYYLTKPVKLKQLATNIKEILSKSN
jgi:PAS domain S-box-containing protein